MQHSPIGIYTYAIDAYLSDFRGKATLPMIGGFMLQAATRHAGCKDNGAAARGAYSEQCGHGETGLGVRR